MREVTITGDNSAAVQLTGTIVDPGVEDTFTLTIDWSAPGSGCTVSQRICIFTHCRPRRLVTTSATSGWLPYVASPWIWIP